MESRVEIARTPMKTPCLVVESSEADQHRIKNILNAGVLAETFCAANLKEAREAASKYRFDLFLLDNALKDGTGVNFAQEIRRHPAHRFTPIILFSDWSTPFLQDKAQAARVNLMIQKAEFHPRHVRDALRYAKVRSSTIRSAPPRSRESPDQDASQRTSPAPGAERDIPRG